MIFVTTPSGGIGSQVVVYLLQAGASLRVIARHPEKLAHLRDCVDIVEGSHADAATLGPALDGVDRVFWLPPGSPDNLDADAAYVGFTQAFCDALPGSSVRHVVGISALGRGWDGSAGLVEASLRMDDRIAATGVAYRALACGSLMDNIIRQIEPIREAGAFYGPIPGDVALPHVARRDVAAVAAKLLSQADWNGIEEIALCGPETLSHNRMADIMSEVLNRDVTYVEIPMAAFGETLRAGGATDGMARDYMDMYAAKAAGMDTMEREIDRTLTPTTFREWCEAELLPAVRG